MQKARVNGVELAYELSGSGKETVVFLNGIAMTIAHWKPFVEALSPAYRCLCHDLRGQILSERPAGPYSFSQHSEDLAALMSRLGIAKAHLVGTSYGSEVAMVFALEHPEMAASLTVVDGVSELDTLLRTVAEGWRAAALASPSAFYRNLIPWTYSASYIAENKATLDAREAGIETFPHDYFTGFVALCDAFLSLDITANLHRIACPTLVLVGDKDILKPLRYSRIIADAVPGATLKIVKDAGHASVVEKPDECIAEIREFLSR